jgi:hypothetical protein
MFIVQATGVRTKAVRVNFQAPKAKIWNVMLKMLPEQSS